MSDDTMLAQSSTEASGEASTEVSTESTETVTDQTTETTDTTAQANTTEEAETADTGKKAAAESEEGSEDEAAPAIDYEAIKLSDGREIDAKALEVAKPVFEEIGLNQEQAQKLVEAFGKIQMEQLHDLSGQAAEKVKAQREEIKSMWGSDYAARMTDVARMADWADKLVLETLPDDRRTVEVEKDGETVREAVRPFRDMLNETGVGDHPVMALIASKLGELFGEDDIAASVRAQGKQTVADRWYSNGGQGPANQ